MYVAEDSLELLTPSLYLLSALPHLAQGVLYIKGSCAYEASFLPTELHCQPLPVLSEPAEDSLPRELAAPRVKERERKGYEIPGEAFPQINSSLGACF